MPEIIQDWLGTRLGILLDLTPQNFGKNTKDGVLLARLLYGYGVIPIHVLQKVKESRNYYECCENLKVLKPWLQHIGVKHDDSALQEVARGEGTTAISLFYSIYLNLERKDTLYYLLVQKERRFSQDRCDRKFKIEWVPEKSIIDSGEDCQASPLGLAFLEKNDMLEWHRAKCKEVVEKIQKVKSKFTNIKKRKDASTTCTAPVKSASKPIEKKLMEENEVTETLKSFERRHLQKCPNLTYSELMKLKNAFETQPCLCVPNLEEAKSIVTGIKHRKRGEIYARNFQENMQHMVLDEQWKEIVEEQNKKFEDVVHETLLKQSHFEKQMTNKLCQIRHQKKVFAENRKLIESLKMEQRSKEFDDELVAKLEIKETYRSNEEFERGRLAELHKKVYNEKVRARREFIKSECDCIVQSITDIAIRISEIRRVTSCQIPKALVKDLKELFFKNLPIFDVLDNYEEIYIEDLKVPEEAEADNETEQSLICDVYNQLKIEERHRQSVLNETDFRDYMNLVGSWMSQLFFPDDTETESPQIVLGYVVHKLLEVKYPVPNQPSRPPLKRMRLKAVVRGLEGDGPKMLADLMVTNNILVVHASDAINFVLSAYKDELAVVRDVDITFQNLTNKALQDKENAGAEKEIKKKVLLMKKEESVHEVESSEPLPHDKETQTPRKIPEDDPLLSINATIGKMAFDALGAGDPVPDIVIVSAIFVYVEAKQDDLDGWVLVNYPRLYSQASELECMLTGYRLLPITDQTYTLEDVEGFTFRKPCRDPFSIDEDESNRTSRLVSKPTFETDVPEDPRTYFDLFLKLKKLGDAPKDSFQESISFKALEEFYTQQDVFHVFEYPTINFQTVKTVGKIILMEKFKGDDLDADLMPKSSRDFFGSTITELEEKWDPAKKKNAKPSAKTTGGEPKKVKEKEAGSVETFAPRSDAVETGTKGGLTSVGKKSVEAPSAPIKPGDPDWEWATGNQSDSLLLALATLWENMEAAFIDDLKDVFFCLRTHRSNVLSYCAFIRKSVQNIMRQPDDKQKVLSDFRQMFNDIDMDLRPDLDIKCELHVRVAELEEALLGIADERKANSLKDITKVTQNGWVADEMAGLVNYFLSIVQLETDRCLVTCQIIIDYYASLQQRVPEEMVIGKISVAKLQIKDRKYSIQPSPLQRASSSQIYTPRNEFRRSSRLLNDLGTRQNFERASKTRSWTEKRRKSSDLSFLTGASEVISEILTNLSLPADGTTPFHNFFKESVQSTTNEITNLMEGYILEAKKGDKSVGKNQKKGSETNPPAGGAAAVEWETALTNELSRFLFRMKLILARGIFDVNEFLATMLNILSSLTEDVNEMYAKEVTSISECCKVFRCCIEEEIPVPVHLILKEDEFYVEHDVFMAKEDESRYRDRSKDEKIYFTTDQLSLLAEKLHRVAPDGEIIKRSLIYILEDLRAFNPEIKACNCFPEVWKSLDPNDMVDLMNEVYQDLEIVHWKDFIIYGLEIAMPSENEILSMRKIFREFDPHLTELITRCDYDKVNFWFEGSGSNLTAGDQMESVKTLLFKMYQVDDYQTNYSALLLAFCKDENPIFGFIKALTLVVGKKINANEYAHEEFLPMQEEGGDHGEEFFENYPVEKPKKPCRCPSSSTENNYTCIPKERIRCTCWDTLKNLNSPRETGPSSLDTWGSEQEEGENGSAFFYKGQEQGSVLSSVPFSILSSLLKASFPSLSQLSALLDCEQTFQDTLNSIYDALESQDDRVEVYKLLRHKFISRLIQSTNKFRFLKLEEIVLNKLKSKNALASSSCVLDKDLCSVSFD